MVVPPRAPKVSLLASMLALMTLTACTSMKVTDRQEYEGPELPRPGRILVYDFAATPGDLPAWSQESQAYAQAGADMDADELDAGRKLGADVAKELVEEINGMGLTALRAEGAAPAELNDLALVGYFTSIDEGSATERVLIGFGKGSASVGVHAAGYHMTENGMVQLGGGTIETGGAGKGPGLVVPTIVTIATANPIGLVVGGAVKAEGEISGRTTDVGAAERIAKEIAKILKPKFEQQGWI